jgi:hypothetical protein
MAAAMCLPLVYFFIKTTKVMWLLPFGVLKLPMGCNGKIFDLICATIALLEVKQ